MTRKIAWLVVGMLVVGMLVGCGNIEQQEERLYKDMEEIYNLALDFLTTVNKDLRENGLDLQRTSTYKRILKDVEDLNAGLKPPSHLKSDVEEWQEHIQGFLNFGAAIVEGEILSAMVLVEGDWVSGVQYGKRRIYNKFEEYEK